MGLLSSSKSSNQTIDESQTLSGGAQDEAQSFVAGGNVTVTDGNAIQNMFDVTMAALSGQQQSAEAALGLNKSSLAFAEKVKNPLGDNVKKLGLYFGVATVLVVIVVTVVPVLKR